MPIHKMQFDDGVFYAKQVGYFDNVDARMWVSALKKYAANSPVPVVAVTDITEVDRLCPTVLKLLSDVLNTPNVSSIAIATGTCSTSQTTRVLRQLSELNGVRVFCSIDEARRYAAAKLRSSAGLWLPTDAATYAHAVSMA